MFKIAILIRFIDSIVNHGIHDKHVVENEIFYLKNTNSDKYRTLTSLPSETSIVL